MVTPRCIRFLDGSALSRNDSRARRVGVQRLAAAEFTAAAPRGPARSDTDQAASLRAGTTLSWICWTLSRATRRVKRLAVWCRGLDRQPRMLHRPRRGAGSDRRRR